MSLDALSAFVGEALALSLLLALPALGAAFVVALIGDVVQAATAVQDPALGFLPRLLAVSAALFVSGSLGVERLVGFTTRLWQSLP
jgi:flagellar biosynthetic protein FliQ